MSKLSIDQRNIKALFQDRKSDFLIPDYQRPYAWDESKCETLWEDLFDFALPGENIENFNEDDEYFLGPIVTYQNDNKKLEVIDGQQRLTTLMLLLRAFYDYFIYAQDTTTVKTRDEIAKCIWKTDINDVPKMDELKIQSEVAGEEDKEEFLNILRTGVVDKTYKSKYAVNFKYFQGRIEEFAKKYSMYSATFVQIIMKNCILLPIEADDQTTALRIFSTLNDRGMPLSDADIFKAQFYKYYSDKGEKETFIDRWKELETLCNKIFHPSTGTPMDEIFTRYMYYERAKLGITQSTTEALRKFYEKDNYAILKKDETFDNIIDLASFWDDVNKQSKPRFTDEVLRRLFVLNYAPNGMWAYFLSVYFMQNKDENNQLDNGKLLAFLEKITAFIWGYGFTNPGVNALRTPIYQEMKNIVNGIEVTFNDFKFDEQQLRSFIENYNFINQRPITRSMLTLWAFMNDKQKLLPLDEEFQIEHIYATNRYNKEETLSSSKMLEKLGNKALLEKDINIRASDYKFADKKPYYYGTIQRKNKESYPTKIKELIEIADNHEDFVEQDIIDRNKAIIDSFIKYLKENNLVL